MHTVILKVKSKALRVMFLALAGLLAFGSACSEQAPEPAKAPAGLQTQAPEEGDEGSFLFAFVSDPQPDPENGEYVAYAEIMERIREKEPDFLISGGDQVNDGRSAEEWGKFSAVVGDIKTYPVVGNHDNEGLIFELFPPEGEEIKKRDGSFYSFTYKNVHFSMLDSNLMGAGRDEDVEWLRSDLEQNGADINIVVMHHPPYTALENPKNEARAEVIREKFVPVFDEFQIDLVLCGHEHCYMRTYPLRAGQKAENGTVYLMAVSGDKQYAPTEKEYSEKSFSDGPVFVMVKAGKALSIEVFGIDGALIDRFETGEKT